MDDLISADLTQANFSFGGNKNYNYVSKMIIMHTLSLSTLCVSRLELIRMGSGGCGGESLSGKSRILLSSGCRNTSNAKFLVNVSERKNSIKPKTQDEVTIDTAPDNKFSPSNSIN